jgi:hypothetical protein
MNNDDIHRSDIRPLQWIEEGVKNWIGSSKVAAAFALFPKDISQPPREWAQRFFNVQRWTEMPRGGHFAALEEPALLAEDIRVWFRQFRQDPISPDESLEARGLILEPQGSA